MGRPESSSVTPDSRLEPLLAEIARRVSSDIEVVAERAASRILAQVPELRDFAVDEPWLRQPTAVRAHIEALLALLPRGIEAQHLEPPAVTQERVRRLVRARMGLGPLLRSYRWGHGEVWEAWQTETLRLDVDAETQSRLLAYSSELFFTYIDRVTQALEELYAREREAWVRSAAAVRTGVVRDLLAGVSLDETVAGARLNYDLRRHHVAFILWFEGDDETAETASLENAAVALGERLGYASPLTVAVSQSTLIGWCARYGEFHGEDLEAACQLEVEPKLRLALGDLGFGVAGFRRSHREAMVTRAIIRRQDDGAPCRHYRQVALASLLVADPDRARRFAASVLGPLADDTDDMRSLRVTLTVLLEEGGSKVASARRLRVHKNTVGNRLERIEALLGRSVERRYHELEAALLVARTLGSSGDAEETVAGYQGPASSLGAIHGALNLEEATDGSFSPAGVTVP